MLQILTVSGPTARFQYICFLIQLMVSWREYNIKQEKTISISYLRLYSLANCHLTVNLLYSSNLLYMECLFSDCLHHKVNEKNAKHSCDTQLFLCQVVLAKRSSINLAQRLEKKENEKSMQTPQNLAITALNPTSAMLVLSSQSDTKL